MPARTAVTNLGCALLALCTLLAGCQTPAPSPVETYGDIRVSDETSDADGLQLELRRDGPSTTAFLVLCEGGCHGAEATDVTVEASTVRLRLQKGVTDDYPEDFVFRRSGGGLIVEQPAWAKGGVLKRLHGRKAGQTRAWARYH